MEPRIKRTNEKPLIGMRLTMSLADYKVGELWKRFMPMRKNIDNNLSNDLLSVTIYNPHHFTHFDLSNEFEKWAAIEVANFDHVPEGMETCILPGGLYAVFDYKGLHTDNAIYQYIFRTWLPGSAYVLDDRPHFEILGEKYRNNDPASEEEVWIPIQLKQ